jgi:hypothetical protein
MTKITKRNRNNIRFNVMLNVIRQALDDYNMEENLSELLKVSLVSEGKSGISLYEITAIFKS